MTLRRRIALFLDPDLAPVAPTYDPYRLPLSAGHWSQMEAALESIAKSMKSLDSKAVKRRPRIIECRHSELHPELEAVA